MAGTGSRSSGRGPHQTLPSQAALLSQPWEDPWGLSLWDCLALTSSLHCCPLLPAGPAQSIEFTRLFSNYLLNPTMCHVLLHCTK